jgi:hypothetical protein
MARIEREHGAARMAAGVRARVRSEWEAYADAYMLQGEETWGAYPLSRETMTARARGEYVPCDGDLADMIRRHPIRVALRYCSEEARGYLESTPFVSWGQWWADYRETAKASTVDDALDELERVTAEYRDAVDALARLDAYLPSVIAMARQYAGVSWETLEDLTGLTRNTLHRRVKNELGRVPAAYSGVIHGG